MDIGSNTFKKFRKRGTTIVLNSLYFLLVPILNFGLYLVVMQVGTAEMWGRLVELLLMVNLVIHVLSWGSTPYLLRSFSLDPATISRQWQEAFFTRTVFFAVPAVFFLAFYSWQIAIWLIVWLLLLFVYRSLEVFVIYLKRFKTGIIGEVCSFALLAGGILYDPGFLEPVRFVQLFSASMLVKVVAVLPVFYKEAFKPLRLRINWRYFKLAFPFTIIAVVGLLHEKIDLYLMALVGTTEELGMYHVLISALNILKTGAAFLVQPYVKNIYRLPYASLQVLSRKMAVAGLAIVSVGTAALIVLIPTFFGFDFEWEVYAMGAAVAFPYYYYINYTHRMYRRHQERKMILFSGTIILLNGILSYLLIPQYGVKGALFASAVTEWLLLIILIVNERVTKRRDN